MSEQQSAESPLSYDGVLEMFRQTDRQFQETKRMIQETSEQMKENERKLDRMFQETDRKFQETAEQMKETDRKMKETDRKISALGSRIGEIVENMVGGGNIVAQFQTFGYEVIAHSRNKIFGKEGTNESGEIDVFLEDGDVAILIEVKTTLKTEDVLEHIERLKKYRRWIDARGSGDTKRFIGAVAGAVVSDEVAKFAQKNGMFVIVQSGDAVRIITPPDDFAAKEW